MDSIYETKNLMAGRDRYGIQKRRQLGIKHTTVKYFLHEITEQVSEYNEEDDWTYTRAVVRRPDMYVTTKVTVCRQHGVIRLYGPQGL